MRNRGRKKIAHPPIVLQMETVECGAACLAMVLAAHGRWVPIEKLRVECGVSRDGSNARNVVMAARRYGMVAAGYRMEVSDLLDTVSFPCVVHWEYNHFIVLNGILGNTFYINDPARGVIRMSREEFEEGYSGVVLTFDPGEEFEPGGQKPSIVRFAMNRLRGMKKVVVFVILTTILGYIFDIINPSMTKVFLTYLVSGENPEWVVYFFLLLALFTVLNLVVEWVKAIYTLRVNGKMAVMGTISYMWHLFRLPMNFFSQRMAGDIIDRQEMNEEMSETFVHTVGPLFLDTVMMVVYCVLMVRYHFYLSLVGITGVLIHMIMARIISQRRLNITRVQMRDEGRMHSYALTGVHMIETIKACGAENGFFGKWSGYQASVYESKSRYVKSEILLEIIPELIRNLTEDAILIVGVWLFIQGEMALGMIMSFQQIMQLFMRPAVSTIESRQLIHEMTMQMERVQDVMEYPEDDLVTNHMDVGEHKKLKGDVEIRNLSFGYATLGDPLIRDFNLHVRPGSRVAIVGESGCGKTTVANLLAGLYQPWEGEILYDGKPIEAIDHRVFTGSLAVVDQDIVLFEDTIANNIKMWDDTIEDFEMILAARDAMLHDEIIQRRGGYNGFIQEGGRDLSGGQRQRMEIARVLAQEPSIIVLDEATSALDADTESKVVEAICKRGITCIVIAHRLSTVRDCDEILVMKHGQVIERGTHEELFEQDGVYKELITDELV